MCSKGYNKIKFMTIPSHYKELTPYRAKRRHRGNNHWHIEERLTLIICRNCGEKILKWKNLKFCPECNAGNNK